MSPSSAATTSEKTSRSRKRQCARERRRLDKLDLRTERGVRPPLVFPRDPAGGTDDAPAGDDDPEVPTARLDQLLGKCAVLAKPMLPLKPHEGCVELVGRRAQLDVPSPAAKSRLEHEGR